MNQNVTTERDDGRLQSRLEEAKKQVGIVRGKLGDEDPPVEGTLDELASELDSVLAAFEGGD